MTFAAAMKLLPLIALVIVFLASLLRGAAIKRNTGDSAWAFASARGAQRLAGIAFGVSILVLAIAAGRLAVGDVATAPDRTLISAVLATFGATIVIVAQVQMGRAWRVGVRDGDAPLFVRQGLFRFSRNPIFVGMILMGLSIAIVSNWWAWLACLVFVFACHFQVRIEEAHLSASFGTAYRDYCRAVSRWLGLPSA